MMCSPLRKRYHKWVCDTVCRIAKIIKQIHVLAGSFHTRTAGRLNQVRETPGALAISPEEIIPDYTTA